MPITERLANLSIPEVLVIMAVLIGLRFALIKNKAPFAKSVAEMAESLAVAMGLVFLLIRPFFIQAFYIPSESMHPGLIEKDHLMVNKMIYRFKEPKLGDVIVFKAPKEATPDEKDFIKRVIGVPGDEVRVVPGYVMVGDQPYLRSELADVLADPMQKPRIRFAKDKVVVNGEDVSKKEIAKAVGYPGKKVKVVPGLVYVNGKPLNEPYTAEDCDNPYPNEGTPKKWVAKDKNGKEVVKIPKGKLLVMGDNRNNSDDARRWGLLDRNRVHGKAMFVFWPLNRIKWIR